MGRARLAGKQAFPVTGLAGRAEQRGPRGSGRQRGVCYGGSRSSPTAKWQLGSWRSRQRLGVSGCRHGIQGMQFPVTPELSPPAVCGFSVATSLLTSKVCPAGWPATWLLGSDSPYLLHLKLPFFRLCCGFWSLRVLAVDRCSLSLLYSSCSSFFKLTLWFAIKVSS